MTVETPPPPTGRDPRPRIDPRLRERRVAVRRHQGRRRLYVLVAALAVPALAGLGYGASRSPLTDLDQVELAGARRTPMSEVRAAAGLRPGRLLVSIDSGRVARAVEALPWVLDARAERRWPGTIRLVVTERVPQAVVPVDRGRRWALVDGTGRILSVGDLKPTGLPVIGGLGDPGPPGSTLGPRATPALLVAEALTPGIRSRVGDVASVAGGEVELQLVPPGLLVRLGDGRQLQMKLRALDTFLAAMPLDDVAVLDLRVATAPVLTRR